MSPSPAITSVDWLGALCAHLGVPGIAKALGPALEGFFNDMNPRQCLAVTYGCFRKPKVVAFPPDVLAKHGESMLLPGDNCHSAQWGQP